MNKALGSRIVVIHSYRVPDKIRKLEKSILPLSFDSVVDELCNFTYSFFIQVKEIIFVYVHIHIGKIIFCKLVQVIVFSV